MKGCLTAVAKIIGGYWYFENKVLYLFLTPPGPAPDPIDDTPNRFLHEPQVKWTIDKSQVRTRVYGKGASSDLAATVDPTVTIVPLEEATMFNPVGGKAIAAVTPDGAASRILTYTGVQVGGGGGLVGPGATPASAPGLALVDGSGIENGVHKYAVHVHDGDGGIAAESHRRDHGGAARGADECAECRRGADRRRRRSGDAYLCADVCHGRGRDDRIAGERAR